MSDYFITDSEQYMGLSPTMSVSLEQPSFLSFSLNERQDLNKICPPE